MCRSLPTRFLCCLLLVLLLVPTGLAAEASASAAPRWEAVLVAGDDAEPVFDNAVTAVARWLQARGVRAAEIHRLSAAPQADPAVEPASADRILDRIAALRPGPGEGCLVFITSHGKEDDGIWLAHDRDFLRPGELARALSAGCRTAPTVAILSSCYSGAFTAIRAANRVVITAARADRPSFGCQADRTYTVFDQCLIGALPREATWRAVYDTSLACVQRNERRLGALPSRPQAFFGSAVRNLPVH